MGARQDGSRAPEDCAVCDRRSRPADCNSCTTGDAGRVHQAPRYPRHSIGCPRFCGAGVPEKGWHAVAAPGADLPALRRTYASRLKLMLVDSHCHLDFPDFADDLDGIVARAAAAGVGRIVTISTRGRRLGALLTIAERFQDVYCSVGTHPHHADEEDGISADELIELTRHPKVVALGEAGLDYFYDNGSPDAQAAGLRAPIPAPRTTGLPRLHSTPDARRGF